MVTGHILNAWIKPWPWIYQNMNIFVLWDFNVCVEGSSMSEFCDTYNMESLIKEPTCYKTPENPSCIDLI